MGTTALRNTRSCAAKARVKACRKLGEERIPALVVTASDDDAFIMSLAENIARRRYKPIELLSGTAQLRDKRYEAREVAQKGGAGGELRRRRSDASELR